MNTIVMTGASSGFGKIALALISAVQGNRVLLGTRSPVENNHVEIIQLDLAILKSVRHFTDTVEEKLGSDQINALVLNAGLSLPTDAMRTEDGMETTFQVNYLANYQIIRRLLPKLAVNSTIILTTSGTYDPAEKTLIPPPLHANAQWLAHPELNPKRDEKPIIAGGRAYSASKLCQILLARALLEHESTKQRGIRVIAFDPGPTPGTNLVRAAAPIMRFIWWALSIPPLRYISPKMNSQADAGRALFSLTSKNLPYANDQLYLALRRGKIVFPELSALARNKPLVDALWEQSANLLDNKP